MLSRWAAGSGFGFWRRSVRIAAVQFRCCRSAVLIIGALQIGWLFLAPAIPDVGDEILGARMQVLSFQLAPVLALMTSFLGLIQARDAGVLNWLRLLTEDPREISLGLSIFGAVVTKLFLLLGSPSLFLAFSSAAPELGWGVVALLVALTILFTLYLMIPAVAFQLWVVIRPQRRPGWEIFWIAVQFIFCAGIAAIPKLAMPGDAWAKGAVIFTAAFAVVVAPPVITVLLIRSASARLGFLDS